MSTIAAAHRTLVRPSLAHRAGAGLLALEGLVMAMGGAAFGLLVHTSWATHAVGAAAVATGLLSLAGAALLVRRGALTLAWAAVAAQLAFGALLVAVALARGRQPASP
jgi:hypothetical protein